MGLIRESVSFKNISLGDTVGTDYLLGNIGDVITATIGARYDGDYVLGTTALIDDPDGLTAIVVNPDAITSGGIIPNVKHLWTSDPIGFENVTEGDEITLDNTQFGQRITIVAQVINSQLLLMTTSYGAAGPVIVQAGGIAYVSTPMRSIEYFFGLIENDEPPNFQSKIDGNQRKSIAIGLSSTTLTNTEMTQLGDKSNQYGSLQIRGNGIGDGPTSPQVSQAFIITHTFVIGPLSLADQNQDTKNGIKPEYLKDTNSLKYVFEVELGRDLTDPNRKKEVIEFDKLGNVGFLGENFNTGITNYSIEDLVFKRANNEVNSALELITDQTTVEFTIVNTVSPQPFSNGNTKFVFNHWLMTTPEEEYRQPQFSSDVNLAKDRNIVENFVFDRIECTLGTLSTGTVNTGTDEQIIISCQTTYVTNSKVNVVATIGMSAAAVSKIGAMSIREYVLSISTKNHLIASSEGDNVNLPIDIGSYFTDLTDPSMIQTDITFVDHPNSDVDTGATTLTVRTDDDVVGVAKFTLDRKDIAGFTRVGVDIGFSSIKVEVIAKKDIDTFFVLDSFERNLNIEDSVNIAPYGTVPIIDIEQDRGFRTPADDLRRDIIVKRRTDLDVVSGIFNYECYFPFIFRWEDWVKLDGVNDEFYDESLPNNGLNHDWARYAAASGWNIFFRFTIVATKDGFPITYTSESLMLVEDYTEGSEWDTEQAKSYIVSSGLEITQGGQSGISLDEATRIEGDMTFNTSPVPSLSDLVMRLTVNVFEKDDFKAQYRISSLYDNTTTDNVWIGLAGILKATKSNPSGSIFRVAAELRPELLAEEQTFRFSWRIYDTRLDDGVPNGMATEDAILMLTEDGILMDVETV